MAPKVPEKQHTQHETQTRQQQQPPAHHNVTPAVKHSNPFHFSALTLCHNKRLKLKRSKYAEYLRNVQRNINNNNCSTPKQTQNSHKTEVRRQKLNSLQADVTIDLLSDEETAEGPNNKDKQSMIVYPGRMCLERAAILGLMPVERCVKPAPPPPPPLVPILNNHHISQQPTLMIPMPKQLPHATQPRKRKSKPQKRRSLPTPQVKTPIILNHESIVLSDDSNDVPSQLPATMPILSMGILQPPDLSVTCPTSSQIPCLPPHQNTMQVDEEVTISLVPRSLNASNCGSGLSLNTSCNGNTSHQEVFPMLPDETTVHTVIANRIYELSLTKLREGLASCGIPEFADGQQKISPQRRKGLVHHPPVVSPPQAPISLKLSSDLSISLISDDEEETRQKNRHHHEPILSPAFLQKLPVNVSIAPVPMRPPNNNHAKEPRKLKLG
ncbi:a6 [Cochliomyia hominivorax]